MECVTNNTRAGKRGKVIQCPHCGKRRAVGHFGWSALLCFTSTGCGTMVPKREWLLVGGA